MQDSTTGRASSPRDRFREQTRTEIKAIALRQLTEGGVDAVALTRIAKEVGLSGPALYRYFANREDLLTSLVRDAYDDAARAIRAAADSAPTQPASALHTLADAYLTWATAEPARYLLIQGTPVPGYSAPPDTRQRARTVIGPFLPIFAAGEASDPVRPLVGEMQAWLEHNDEVAAWVSEYTGLRAADSRSGIALAGATLAWSQLHGTISLHVSGQYAGMGHRTGTLLATQVTTLAAAFGLAV